MATVLYNSAYLKSKMLGNITGTAYTFPSTQYVAQYPGLAAEPLKFATKRATYCVAGKVYAVPVMFPSIFALRYADL